MLNSCKAEEKYACWQYYDCYNDLHLSVGHVVNHTLQVNQYLPVGHHLPFANLELGHEQTGICIFDLRHTLERLHDLLLLITTGKYAATITCGHYCMLP